VSDGDLMRGGYSIFHDTMADMTYPEVARAATNGAVVLWGLGVIEQHGPHLPLATDVYMPAALLRRVRQLLAEKNVDSLIMPPFYWGVNHVTGLFPGSFEVRPAVMVELMIDLIKSLKKDGFSTLFSVTGHGDALHNRTILEGLRRGGSEAGMNTYFVGAPSFFKRIGVDPADPNVLATASEVERKSKFFDVHAGEFETSSMWGFYPELVRTEVLPSLKSTDFGAEDIGEWRQGREMALRKTPQGYLGDPAASDPAKGTQQLLDDAAVIADAIISRLQARCSRQ
jgi:creatinine amidohydrolase